eukprot:4067133-Pleurochrysis_carterae.AAC.1
MYSGRRFCASAQARVNEAKRMKRAGKPTNANTHNCCGRVAQEASQQRSAGPWTSLPSSHGTLKRVTLSARQSEERGGANESRLRAWYLR